MMNTSFSRGHKTLATGVSRSQDNIQGPLSPRENNPHIQLSIPPIITRSPESPGNSYHTTPQTSVLNLTCEASTRSLVSGQDDQSLYEGSSSSNRNVLGVSGVRNDREIADHERIPEIWNPEHPALQPGYILPVYPTWPSKIPRWDNKSTFIAPKSIEYEIKAGRKDYSRPKTVGDSHWEWLTHPDGLPYFYYREKNVITEAYVPQDDVRFHVERFIDEMEEYIKTAKNIDATVYANNQRVLVFEDNEESGPVAYYYFVDHKYQSIFWLENLPGDELVTDLQVDELSETQFGFKINSEYWLHRSLYPGLQSVSAYEIAQVHNAVHSAMSDTVFSAVSTSPFPYETLEKIEEIMEKRIKTHSSSSSPGSEGWLDPVLEKIIGQTLQSFSKKRFLDCYGEKLSRLSADQHLHPGSHGHKTSSRIMLILTYMLFFSPRPHLKKLREVYVDFMVVQHSWKEYIERLNQDWEAILILEGVVLAVVVSFLAMPSVDTAQGTPEAERSSIQLLGYASVILNITSIVIVLMLKSLFYKSKSQGQTVTEKASKTLRAAHDSQFGLEGLAIVFSLPRVLMIWGILSFAGAFFTLCFRETTLVTRLLSGIPAAINAGICLWSFWMLRVSDIKIITSKVIKTITVIPRQFWPWSQEPQEFQDPQGTTGSTDNTSSHSTLLNEDSAGPDGAPETRDSRNTNSSTVHE